MPQSSDPSDEPLPDQREFRDVPSTMESTEAITASVTPATTESRKESSSDGKERAWLWLRRSDQIFVWLMVVLLLILLGIHWLRLSKWGRTPVELSSQKPREYFYTLDINTASWVEWAQLDGIGEKLARRIIADREERGPFRNPADVGRVRGIGPKTLEKIRPFLRGGSDVSDPPASGK